MISSATRELIVRHQYGADRRDFGPHDQFN
jgi:hypothetical protein